MLCKKPEFLYKYLSQEGAQALFNSDDPSIRFSLSNAFNDPFDVNPSGRACNSSLALIGVLCLCETPSSIPMWGHYAQGKVKDSSIVIHGGGVVLEFFTESSFFREHPPLRVRYSKKRPSINNRPDKQLTSKSVEWSYEREWRSFLDVASGEQGQFAINWVSKPFPFEALRSVIVGYDSHVSVSNFLNRPEASHVTLKKAVLDSERYKINIVDSDIGKIFVP